jgi:AraC family transcriptional regulator
MRLPPGEYLGRAVREHREGGLRLVLSDYAPATESAYHTHVHPTFFVLLRGDHVDLLRHGDRPQRPGTAVFHPVTLPHATRVGRAGMRGLNVEASPAWLARYGLDADRLDAYRVYDGPGERLRLWTFLAAAFAPGAAGAADVETAAAELFEPLAAPSPAAGRPRWLYRAEEFLRDRFRDPVTLRTVADEVGVHPVYCARVFRHVFGCPVSRYLRRLRLAEAGRLAVHEGYPLAQAAVAAGFADQAHLTRVCAATLGFTPKRFRDVRAALGLA